MQHEPNPAKRRVVLVVDDEYAICHCLAELLEGEGYETVTAQDGDEALAWLSGHAAPHAMILDLMMPRVSGWDVLTSLTQGRRRDPPFPVVVVSAFPGSAKRTVEGFHPTAVFGKPVDLDALLATLARVNGTPTSNGKNGAKRTGS
jgi:CheY-like chemotaxis protein